MLLDRERVDATSAAFSPNAMRPIARTRRRYQQRREPEPRAIASSAGSKPSGGGVVGRPRTSPPSGPEWESVQNKASRVRPSRGFKEFKESLALAELGGPRALILKVE